MTSARLSPLPLVLLLLFTCCPAAAARSQPPGQEQPAARYHISIGKLRSEIRSHQEKIRRSGAREISLLEEIELIDRKIATEKEKIRTLQERLQAQEEILAKKTRVLDQVRAEEEKVRRHLQTRLRAFYLMGTTGVLNVVFSRRSLPELVLFDDSFRSLIKHDQAAIDAYRTAIARLHRAMEAERLEKSVLEDFIRQADEEKKKLAAARLEKKELLQRVRTRKGLYKLAVREMKKAETELASTLTTLRKKEKSRQRGFLLNRGRMEPPVQGRLVRGYREKGGDSALNNGIIIDVPDKTPVRAIYPGKVLFSGYMRGFGNMIIIDHGLRYFTVTARLEKRLKKEGEQVDEGEVIGMAGDIATLFDPGIYFEIRHGAESLDPLQWLVPGAYEKRPISEQAAGQVAAPETGQQHDRQENPEPAGTPDDSGRARKSF